jgi:uncharacterized membrane protein
VLFLAALCLSLTAGRAFWVWLGENPLEMSGQSYVEFFQHVDERIAGPIAATGVGGTLLVGLAAFASRTNRVAFRLLLVACALALISSLVTVFGNVPINSRLATWDPTALPPDYQDFLRQWWQWHQVRFVAMFGALCLVLVAMLTDDRTKPAA